MVVFRDTFSLEHLQAFGVRGETFRDVHQEFP